MPGTMQLGHTVIYVSDLDTSREWYRHLGMTVVVESPERNGCFLSFGKNDHDIALFENPVAKGKETINHIALKFDGSIAELAEFRQGLIDEGVKVQRTVDHGVSYGIYFNDPMTIAGRSSLSGNEANRVDAMRATGAMSDPVELETVVPERPSRSTAHT